MNVQCKQTVTRALTTESECNAPVDRKRGNFAHNSKPLLSEIGAQHLRMDGFRCLKIVFSIHFEPHNVYYKNLQRGLRL